MLGVRNGWKTWMAAGVLAMLTATGAAAQQGNRGQRKARRESNAARKARIARTIQETYAHKYEIFGGGGYLRFRSGEFTKRNNEVVWAASGTYFLTPKLGVIGDARGEFGHANALINNVYGVYHPQINEYTFLGGANYRVVTKEKTAVSVQAMGGVGWGIFSGGSVVTSPNLGIWPDGFRPAFSVGVSGDYNFYPNLAFRVTPTYVGTMFGGKLQNNVGVNAGIVYRFGKR